MCSQPLNANNDPFDDGDALAGVLAETSRPVPKVSLPIPAVGLLTERMATLTTLLGARSDEEQTLHVTADEAFLSTGDPKEGNVVVLGARGALQVHVVPPADDGPVWKFELTLLPAGAATGADPHVTIDVVVGGDSAKVAGITPSTTAARELSLVGIDIMCILKNGGASILSTIVRCLPSLAAGPEAFMAALVAALGPGSVDLITRVMACF
jgi:hypothetical protein